MGRRIVLYFGSNFIGTNCPLGGCLNDIDDMLAELRDNRKPDVVVVLKGPQANGPAVKKALRDIVAMAKPGDHVLVAFSSHGVQIPVGPLPPTDPRFEADRLIEAVCCDGFNWSLETCVTDDELAAFERALAPGVFVTIFADCCHSASLTKAMLNPGVAPRFYWDVENRPPLPAAEAASCRNLFHKGEATRGILFAACHANETADDATIDRRRNGAFTRNVIKALNADGKAGWNLPASVVFQKAEELIHRGGSRQCPAVEWAGDENEKPFFF